MILQSHFWRKTWSEGLHAPKCSSQHAFNSQDVEATETSIDREMDKDDVVHVYNGTLLSHKKNHEIVPLAATWMDLEVLVLSNVSQTK